MTEKELVAKYICDECVKVGFTVEAIQALFGQIEQESHFKPNNVQDGCGWSDEAYTNAVDTGAYQMFPSDDIGYGLYQLTYEPRKTAFLKFVRERGVSIGDRDTQVAFMLYEMRTSFPGIWSQMRTSHDLPALVWVLLDQWENPKEKQKNYTTRLKYAKEWLEKVNEFTSNTAASQSNTREAPIRKVLALAAAQVDYHEKASNAGLDDKAANNGTGNFTKYARDLDEIPSFYNGKKQGAAWCDMFYDWLFVKCFGADVAMKMLCQPQNSAGAGCKYSKQYYQAAGRFVRDPQIGAQIFFYDAAGQINHTGLVESINGGQITTIEGNTMDRVARQTYSINDGTIAGYGIPVWELAMIQEMNGSSISTVPAAPTVNLEIDMNIANNMYLRLGDKNEYVATMQNRLIELGYDVGKDGADGDFGTDTLAALKQFQYDHNLPECGYFGPKTFEAMKPKASESQTTPSVPGQSPSTQTGQKEFQIGDIVRFTGDHQYIFANFGISRDATPGRAVVAKIKKGAAHPYYLEFIINGGSNIRGWANAADMEAAF